MSLFAWQPHSNELKYAKIARFITFEYNSELNSVLKGN